MDETSTPASLSLQGVPKVSPKRSRRSSAATRSWMPRPAYVAIAFVLFLTIGWGAFSVIGRQWQDDDDEAELADLDGFDAQSPTQDETESPSKLPTDDTSRTLPEPATPERGGAAFASNELPTLSEIPDQQVMRFEQSPLDAFTIPRATSGAWLIGTIEVDDSPERIAMPSRVSQTVADGPLLR